MVGAHSKLHSSIRAVQVSFLILVVALASGGTASLLAAERQQGDHVREALLSLPWVDFDQKPNSGWRSFVNADRKEYLVAAKLIEAYLIRHQELTARQRALLHYHAAHQYIYRAVRGKEGDVRDALPHLEGAIVPSDEEAPSADWNVLVAATKAFLTGDREALLALRSRISELPMASIKFMKSPHSLDDLLINLGKPYGSWFQNSESKKMPNKAPEPTTTAVTQSAP